MLFTSAGVLLVGVVRWYLGRFHSGEAEIAEVTDTDAAEGGRLGLVAKLTAFFNRDSADAETPDRAARARARREHAVERSARSTAAERRTGRRPATSSRTRRPRPPIDDAAEPTRERTQRRRPTREFADPEPPRRSSSRQPRDPDLRGRPPREIRRDPHARRGRPTSRGSRFDPYEPIEPFDAPAPPPRRRPAPNGTTATHHPISQVRYRKAAGGEEPLDGTPAATAQAVSRVLGLRRLAAGTSKPAALGSPGAARTPASRWPWSPAEPRHSRVRPTAPGRRAPTPRAPTRRTSLRRW